QLAQGGPLPRPRQATLAPRLLASEAEWQVKLSNAELKTAAHWLALTSHGKGLVIYDNRFRLLDPVTGKDAFVVAAPVSPNLLRSLWALSADGRALAANVLGKGGATVKIWDLATGKELGAIPAWPIPAALTLS